MPRLLRLRAMANPAFLASGRREVALGGGCMPQAQGTSASTSPCIRWRPPSLTRLSAQQAWRHPIFHARQLSTGQSVRVDSAAPLVVGPAENIEDKELHVEASESYLSYAMSVIVGRALPDVRDGLKPVHRRILYAMHDLGLAPNKPHRKCARVVGEVLGKYHPHGDSSVYDALVRLAQDFSMRLPLVAGHGNFGSLDDDPPAAMRYTECRLAPASAELLLSDLDLDTVDFAPTFDAAQEEPLVLPSKIPQLLVNGAQGIAVGIATKIPPHNVNEVVAALIALIKNPHITTEELMQHLPAPDFPTGGEILQGPGILEAYETGHGAVIMRAKIAIEGAESSASGTSGKKKRVSRSKRSASPVSDTESTAPSAVASMDGADGPATASGSGRALIVVTEMPYQLNKAELVEKIAALVEARTIEGVVDVRDESDRDGTRVVVEVKRGFSATVVLNQLLKHTRLQQSFACNMVALVDGVPRALPLKAFLQHFLDFRCDVVERRARHRLARAQQRLHLVDGFLAAMERLDDVVQAIRSAQDGAAAKATLCAPPFGLSEEQADGVLSLTLRRLTALEGSKLRGEAAQLRASIGELQQLLGSKELVLAEVGREAQEAAKRHGEPRRSMLVASADDGDGQGAPVMREEDLVPNHPSLLIFSKRGFIKRLRSDTWETQRRGGKGKAGGLRDNDALEEVTACMAHDHVLFLSKSGRAHIIRAHKVPEAARTSKGTAIAQVLGLDPEDSVTAMIPLPQTASDTSSSSNSSNNNGSKASSHPSAQEHFIVLATSNGSVKRLTLSSIMTTAQRKTGTKAVNLQLGDELVAAGMVEEAGSVLLASSGGKVSHFLASQIMPRSKTAGSIKGMKLKEGEKLVSMVQLTPQLAAATQDWCEQEAVSTAQPDEPSTSSPAALAPVTAAGAAVQEGTGELSSIERIGGPWLLLMSSKGRGKRVPVVVFAIKGRASTGIVGMKLGDGDAVSTVHLVESGDEIVCASRQGLMSRLRTDAAPVLGRATKGVKLMELNDGDEVWAVARMAGSSGHVVQEQGE